jgi:hypothetical protein
MHPIGLGFFAWKSIEPVRFRKADNVPIKRRGKVELFFTEATDSFIDQSLAFRPCLLSTGIFEDFTDNGIFELNIEVIWLLMKKSYRWILNFVAGVTNPNRRLLMDVELSFGVSAKGVEEKRTGVGLKRL